MKKFVLIDNKENCVLSHSESELKIRAELSSLGEKANEKLSDDFYRYAWEEWSEEEFEGWKKDPSSMGLGDNGISFLSGSLPIENNN